MEFAFNDEDREETIRERKERDAIGEQFASGGDKVTDDHQPVPLFPGIRSDPKRTVGFIEVVKVDPPGDGYKGRLPPGTTHETISKMFGNGIYDLTCIAESGKILRRLHGQKISIEWGEQEVVEDDDDDDGQTFAKMPADMRLLHWQNDRHKESMESFGQMMAELQKAQTAQHVQNMANLTAGSDRASAREQTFMTAMLTMLSQNAAAQQTFMNQQMQSQEQAHQRSLERSRAEQDNTFKLFLTMQERTSSANDPNLFLAGMQQGMALLGPGDDGGEEADDTVPWVQALKAGTDAIKDITSTVKVKAVADLRAAKGQTSAPPAKTETAAGASSPPKKRTRSGITPNELNMIIMAKRLCEQKQIPFDQAIRQFGQHLAEVPVTEVNAEPGATSVDVDEQPTPDDVVGG